MPHSKDTLIEQSYSMLQHKKKLKHRGAQASKIYSMYYFYILKNFSTHAGVLIH